MREKCLCLPADSRRPPTARPPRFSYYQGLTTEAVAGELKLSRPKVSRLLSFAKQTGLVEVRIHDAMAQPQRLEQDIQRIFGIPSVRVVAVPSNSSADA